MLYVYYPDTASSSLLFGDLFRALACDGADITVVCGFPSKEESSEQLRKLPRSETIDGVKIIRCGLRLDAKKSLWARAIGYSSFLLQAATNLLQVDRDAIVACATEPPFIVILLWAVSHFRRMRYQVVVLDVYPDGLVALGALSESNVLTRLWRLLNRLSYRRASRVVPIGRDIANRLVRRYGVDPDRVVFVPHWGVSEVDAVQYTPDRPMLVRLGLEDKFVVQYSGNMGLWHDMDTLVRAAHLLREEDRIHFLFIGKGRRRAPAERLARELGLQNITWLEYLPREQLSQSLLSCDAALISMREGLEGVAVPSKLYGILASGRPVIAQVPGESEIAMTVIENDCGLVVPPRDAPGLAAAIRSLAADPDGARLMGKRGQEAYHAKYSLDAAAASFTTLWTST